MKVKKITPIKKPTLCIDKCKFGLRNNGCLTRPCDGCKVHIEGDCKCTTIKNGQPCPYFERYVEEAQK